MQEPTPTGEQRAVRSAVRLAVWTAAWAASLALAKFGPAVLWDSQLVVSWITLALNLVLGVGWIVAHARYLRAVDDLQRKILLDAIAVALGVGLVGGFAYAAASSTNLIAFDSSIAVLSALMAVVYLVAIAVGTLRYR